MRRSSAANPVVTLRKACARLPARGRRAYGLPMAVDAERTRIRLCGRLAVELYGERVEERLPGRQGRLVVAYLAANRERPVSRDELIGLVWAESAPADPEEALSALLSKVRRGLGEGVLDGRSELSLALPADAWIDVERALVSLE